MKHFVSLIAVLFFVTSLFSQEYGWYSASGAEKVRAANKTMNLTLPMDTYQLSADEDRVNRKTNTERISEPLIVYASYAYVNNDKLIKVAKADYKLPTNIYVRGTQGKVAVGTLNYAGLPTGVTKIKVRLWGKSVKPNSHKWNSVWINPADPFYMEENGQPGYEFWIDIITGVKTKVKKG